MSESGLAKFDFPQVYFFLNCVDEHPKKEQSMLSPHLLPHSRVVVNSHSLDFARSKITDISSQTKKIIFGSKLEGVFSIEGKTLN